MLPRKTFAIISHPDAGKTTLTERLLFNSGTINVVGNIKSKKSEKFATSDWMKIEQERGISITSAAMQFEFKDHVINLLDTPGHQDFSEDTYRTLTAVDSALMVIDFAKGVEERTIKLLEVCRLRDTPIITFINKLDRFGKDFIELIDEIEEVLQIKCVPMNLPIGRGKDFLGLYDIKNQNAIIYKSNETQIIELKNLKGLIDDQIYSELEQDIEVVENLCDSFQIDSFLKGEITPLFFGSAIKNIGIQELLDGFIKYAPEPLPKNTNISKIDPSDPLFSGFVFKIQANMDPAHRDRIAFLRICSGNYKPGINIYQTRTKKKLKINNALTFMASDRQSLDEAFAGDIIGIHNHGTINIGDSFTQGEDLNFIGIPNFAPEMFKRVVLKDPLKSKALKMGLKQLCEEGATQMLQIYNSNDILLGAVGSLQFDVVLHRLKNEYNVNCILEGSNFQVARWLRFNSEQMQKQFVSKLDSQIAIDHQNDMVFLASSRVNLSLTEERWPEVIFSKTREINY